MVVLPQTPRALDSAASLIERGQRRVDASAAQLAQVPAVPKVAPSSGVREQQRGVDLASRVLSKADRQSLVTDLVELSKCSFEVKAGAKVARIQEELSDTVMRLGQRFDLTI